MKYYVEQFVDGKVIDISQGFDSYEVAEKFLKAFIETKKMVFNEDFDESQLRIVKKANTVTDEELKCILFVCGTCVIGMTLTYVLGWKYAMKFAERNALNNLNTILAKMSVESATEFVRVFKSIMH